MIFHIPVSLAPVGACQATILCLLACKHVHTRKKERTRVRAHTHSVLRKHVTISSALVASPHDTADAQGETSPVELQEAKFIQDYGMAVLLSHQARRSPSTHLRRNSLQGLSACASPRLLSSSQAPQKDVRASALPRRDSCLVYTCVEIFEDDAYALQHAPARLTSIRQWADMLESAGIGPGGLVYLPSPKCLDPVQAPSQEAEKRQINEKVGHDARIVAQGREPRRNAKFEVPAEAEELTLGDLGLSLGEWLPLGSWLPSCQVAGANASAHETLLRGLTLLHW